MVPLLFGGNRGLVCRRVLKNHIIPSREGYSEPVFFSTFAPQKADGIIRRQQIKMVSRFYHISIRFLNKICDFHAWGAASQRFYAIA